MKNKGITIIEMVIVILILILLAIVTIWSSKETGLKAEATVLYGELKAMHTGVLKIQQEYNLEIFDDYTKGVHYNDEYRDASDNIVDDWYIVYGIDHAGYDEEVVGQLGLDEIKRNYKINFEDAKVEFLDGGVMLGEYKINSYEDMVTLMESGAI